MRTAPGRRSRINIGQGMETVVEGFELVGVAVAWLLEALAAIVWGAIAYARGERQGLYKRVRGEVGDPAWPSRRSRMPRGPRAPMSAPVGTPAGLVAAGLGVTTTNIPSCGGRRAKMGHDPVRVAAQLR